VRTSTPGGARVLAVKARARDGSLVRVGQPADPVSRPVHARVARLPSFVDLRPLGLGTGATRRPT